MCTRVGDFYDDVMKVTAGKGVNLVVNAVGGSMFAECVRSLAFEGRLATVGYVDGVLKSEIDIQALHVKRLTLFGVSNKMRSAEQRAAAVPGTPGAPGTRPSDLAAMRAMIIAALSRARRSLPWAIGRNFALSDWAY